MFHPGTVETWNNCLPSYLVPDALEERIELIVEEKRRAGGFGLAVLISFLLHAAMLLWLVQSRPLAVRIPETPITRYVELISRNPQEKDVIEAPGPAVDKAPLRAPLSDANRKASMPEPTGDRLTTRPGDGRSVYTPPAGSAPSQPRTAASSPAAPAMQPSDQTPTAADADRLTYRVPAPSATRASAPVDWRAAIHEVGRVASLGAGDTDFGAFSGGEKGFTADTGPLSFETGWFDWGDYSVSMVSRIRRQWYEIMPPIVFTGLQGIVTLRFTIQKDGRVTDVTIMNSSGVPPYDYAARKAIENASPFAPLPKGFPKPSERVLVMFYYNSTPKD